MANTVKLKRSAVASAVPTTAQLELGELAINTNDGKLFLKRNNGTESIVEVGAGGGAVGTVTSVNGSGGTTGLTLAGGPITSSGTLTIGGTLAVANGGTGATTLTANNVILGNGTTAVQFVAPGASGNVLTSNGTTWTSAAAGASLSGVTQSVTPFETALGFQAGNVSTGLNNTFIGYQAGLVNTTGENNIAIGAKALDQNTTGFENVALGVNALGKNNGIQNVAIGVEALSQNSTGQLNSALGHLALSNNTDGGQNSAFGHTTLLSNTTGVGNTAVGYAAGMSITTGSNNILIGYNAAASSATISNETTIGTSSTTSARIFGDLKFNNSYTEKVFAITDGATVNLDPNNGSIQTWTLGANRTPGQANWASGQSITLMIDDGTAFAITWTTLGVVWETNAGSAPTLATTGFTVIVLWKVGTTIYGARVGDA